MIWASKTNLREGLQKEFDVVVNVAITTNFDERYDVGFGINTFRPLSVLNFAKKCVKAQLLLHVSTDIHYAWALRKEHNSPELTQQKAPTRWYRPPSTTLPIHITALNRKRKKRHVAETIKETENA